MSLTLLGLQNSLLEYNEEEERYSAAHHPFTSPMDEDIRFIRN